MLRDYQQNLIDKTFKAYNDGYTAPCIVLPCGGGKSIILAEIAKIYTLQEKNVLFLVHRKELCSQIEKTFVEYGVDMNFCKIAMVQTVTRHLNQTKKPDLIITDENHHSKAKTYKRIYEYFSDVQRIGVTATPERIDGSGLIDVNDKLIIGVSAKWLIKHNYLVDYDYYAPAIMMPKFRVRNGDFVQSEVAKFFLSNKKIFGDVIENYIKIANGKKAIYYMPTVGISKLMADKFKDYGISAEHLDGETPKNQRDEIINKFRTGEITVLCNVDIVSEGFDVPDCEVVGLMRPTKSLILYTQQAMRCMRYKPNKRAIIIDHTNNIRRFGFPDTDREWLLEGHPKQKKNGEAPVKTCPHCYRTVPINTEICPSCDYKFDVSKGKTLVRAELVNIHTDEKEKLRQRVNFYLSPSDCQNVEELSEYARQHGYKPGWVWYQQKARGWLDSGNKQGNKNTKRYPCRAIQSWSSTP